MRPFFLLLLLSMSTASFAAKVYQWRDSSGNVFYSDQPPPNTAAKERTIRPNIVNKASEPSSNGNNATNAPQIVLWIMPQCGSSCDDAVALLDSRKILYDVKTADPGKEATMIEFFSLVGSLQKRPPVLVIGKDVLKEWNSAAWHAAITKAGFPRPNK